MMNYQFSEHLIFRTPLKPVKLNFSDDELVELFNEKVAKEALFLASPSLYQAFEKWQENRMHSIKTQEKLFNSLRKYALRMHNRATPFGLFASCGTAQWAKTASEPIRLSAYYRRTKLDMHYSVALSQYLDKQPYIQPYLHFYPNSSIYLLGNEFRYIEYYYQNHKRIHQISAVDASVYVRLVLEKAQNGATIHVLSEHITNENIALEEAKDFIQLMIDAQLLVSELEPTVSGGDLMDQLIHTLGNIEKIAPSPSLHRMLSLMVTIQKKLNSIDQFMGNAITDYHHIIDLLAEIGVAYEVDKLFQTDLFTAHQAHYVLPSAFQPQLRKVLKVLNCLQPAKELPTLQTFITKFQERYETQSIPLLTALDTETGVGYGDHLNHSGDLSPLIQEMIVPTADEDRHITLNQENAFLFSKLQEAQRNQAYSIN
ncbi:MAG: lantibiotic dehydratase family protein, partial [Flammeovirgaceae bacterium]